MDFGCHGDPECCQNDITYWPTPTLADKGFVRRDEAEDYGIGREGSIPE